MYVFLPTRFVEYKNNQKLQILFYKFFFIPPFFFIEKFVFIIN